MWEGGGRRDKRRKPRCIFMGKRSLQNGEKIKVVHLHGLDSLTCLLSNLCSCKFLSAFLFLNSLYQFLSPLKQVRKPQTAGWQTSWELMWATTNTDSCNTFSSCEIPELSSISPTGDWSPKDIKTNELIHTLVYPSDINSKNCYECEDNFLFDSTTITRFKNRPHETLTCRPQKTLMSIFGFCLKNSYCEKIRISCTALYKWAQPEEVCALRFNAGSSGETTEPLRPPWSPFTNCLKWNQKQTAGKTRRVFSCPAIFGHIFTMFMQRCARVFSRPTFLYVFLGKRDTGAAN